MDGREWRIRRGGEVDVVEPHDADVARDGQAPLANRPDGADRHAVAHRQDRGRPATAGPDSLERRAATIDARGAGRDRLWRNVDPGIGERVAVAAEAAGDDAALLV